MTPPRAPTGAARQRRGSGGSALRRRLVAATVALLLAGIAGALSLAYLSPATVARVPGALDALASVAARLPARVAWVYDRGSPRLRPGVYLGWSDGTAGELHLYGRGCSLEGEDDGLAVLRLSGPSGTLELDGSAVEHLRSPLDHTQLHPYLRLKVATERSLDFDRVDLRCRSGAEASARVAARVVHVPAVSTGSELYEARLAVLSERVSLPSVGVVAELLTAGDGGALTLASVEYAPGAAATGEVLAAYGRHAQVSLWRSLVYPPTPGVQRVDPAALTPWDSAFQPASDPGVLRRRPATALDLPLDGPTFALLLLDTGSFVATPQPRPVLVRPLVTFLAGGEAFVGTTDAVAFGWTTRYAAGW